MKDFTKPQTIVDGTAGNKHSFIDALKYPLCFNGLIHIGIITALILFANIAISITSYLGPMRYFLAKSFVAFYVITYGYFFYYFAACIRHSAKAVTKAPDTVSGPDYSEITFELTMVLLPTLLATLPFALYYGITENTGLVFWLLLVVGAVLLPILLLRSLLIGTGSAYNPFGVIFSIIKTMGSYVLLIIQSCIVLALGFTTVYLIINQPFLNVLLTPVSIYFAILFAHLIGRFYLKNAAVLDWE